MFIDDVEGELGSKSGNFWQAKKLRVYQTFEYIAKKNRRLLAL
jgi:hypothetical protein